MYLFYIFLYYFHIMFKECEPTKSRLCKLLHVRQKLVTLRILERYAPKWAGHKSGSQSTLHVLHLHTKFSHVI